MARRSWPVDVHPLPPLLHNHPDRVVPAVERLVDRLGTHYPRVAIAYADCGTYGALDDLCHRKGLRRLRGQHCYEVFAGAETLATELAAEPGTYLLTDYLVRSFHRSVIVELGLDRYPDLRDDYFGHYRRALWLAQRPTPDLRRRAQQAAATLGLPLVVRTVGDAGLERELAALLEAPSAPPGDGDAVGEGQQHCVDA